MKIDDCFESLRSAYSDWGEHFANRNFCSRSGQVSWANDKVRRHSSVLGAEEFFRLVENRQYSFQSLDGSSIFRLFYGFDDRGRVIREASLGIAFAPTGVEWINKEHPLEGQEGVCHWLRLDFDPDEDRPPNHAACHLHISNLPNARIPVSRLPSPRQFISWAMSLTHPTEHDAHFSEDVARVDKLNAPSFTEEWCDGLRNWAHLAMPPIPVPVVSRK